MFESIKRAYDRDAFTDDCPCAIDLETTEIYLQILKPAYKVSIGFQKNNSNICDVIPNILHLIDFWTNLDVPVPAKRLCRLLITCVMHKFKFELNSSIYQV
jgi:hypothetical protein